MHTNAVTLCGRLAEDPSTRALPTGGEVVSWRLIVDRPNHRGRRVVDTITCAAFDPQVRAQTTTWRKGDLIEAQGALRRRFWNSDELRIGRYEVEVHKATLQAIPLQPTPPPTPQTSHPEPTPPPQPTPH
ncbi:single-stranded DNA-binding protein [Spirillospora sp. CA-294931]|uniref:single-stranded DNA-binding protein n=1 Tax=Spirillospora sp. CA-294931 TaxID=3240042 RepID=UPI003D94AA9A